MTISGWTNVRPAIEFLVIKRRQRNVVPCDDAPLVPYDDTAILPRFVRAVHIIFWWVRIAFVVGDRLGKCDVLNKFCVSISCWFHFASVLEIFEACIAERTNASSVAERASSNSIFKMDVWDSDRN